MRILRACRQGVESPSRQARAVEVGVGSVAKSAHLGVLVKTRRRKMGKKQKSGDPAEPVEEMTAVEVEKE